MTGQSLIEKLEADKFEVPEPGLILEEHRLAKLNFNHGMDHAIVIVRQHEVYQMPDGRPVFGEGSPHEIGEHLEQICGVTDQGAQTGSSPTRTVERVVLAVALPLLKFENLLRKWVGYDH